MAADNFHATALVLGERGILITGASGSGKTTLALKLLSRAGPAHRFASLIADDQLFLSCKAGRLICRGPETIRGLAEVRGLGPRPLRFEPAAIVDLLIRLVPASDAERFPEPATTALAGCRLPCLVLAERNTNGAALAIDAWLAAPPFG